MTFHKTSLPEHIFTFLHAVLPILEHFNFLYINITLMSQYYTVLEGISALGHAEYVIYKCNSPVLHAKKGIGLSFAVAALLPNGSADACTCVKKG